MDEKKPEYITFQVEADLKKRFQEKCKSEDTTISQNFRRYMKSYLGENE